MIAKSLFHTQHHPLLVHQSPTEEIVLHVRQQTESWKLLFEERDDASPIRKHKLWGKERASFTENKDLCCALLIVSDEWQ